jgi:hypothetical protein
MSSDPYAAQSFEDFWPHYVRQHQRPETQWFHAAATLASCALVGAGVLRGRLVLVLLAPLVNHAIAQTSHRLFERNRTTPLRHPRYHTRAEFRMLACVLCGRMNAEVTRHGTVAD